MQIIKEAKSTSEGLWKYYNIVEKNPRLDDLQTLLKNIQDTYAGTDSTGMMADFLGGIRHNIIPKLPPQDQQEALRMLQNLKVHSNTELLMKLQGLKKFNDVQEVEEFILNGLKSYGASAVVKVLMNPGNKYWWQMVSDDIKKELTDALKEEERRSRNQKGIGDIMKDYLKNPEEPQF